MKGAPRSKEFDDVYFSAEDGLAETRHVFLAGNNLPAAWSGRPDFTIAETGFGAGLNFLAVWALFDETKAAGQRLHFISFEKYPLNAAEIRGALEGWRGEFPQQFDLMLQHYPARAQGRHTLDMGGGVELTLVFGDVNTEMPRADFSADCWFLDGFRPASNPEMWTRVVFENMARLSAPGATFATFTAAGFVRRGLQDAGFTVRKVRGFGRKRDMLNGVKS